MSGSAKPRVSAAVLAGGQSRRMGSDKALLTVAGLPLLQRAIQTLNEVSDDVFVAGARFAYRQFGARVVEDLFPGSGALGGIATAIAHAEHEHTLVVACDMPFLRVALLRAMLEQLGDEDVLAPVVMDSSGAPRVETLHAVYSRRCLAPITERIERGDLRVADLYDDVSVRLLDERWLRTFDPGLESFLNANDPVGLETARERMARKHPTPEECE